VLGSTPAERALVVLSVLNQTKQPETHYYLPPWLPYEQILCAEYRSSVLNNNVSGAKLSSKTEPASEPVNVLGNTATKTAVVECNNEESNDKHTTINTTASVSAATACEHPVIPEGDVTLSLDQALADCKVTTTTTGESVVVVKRTGQACNQLTRTSEAAFNIRSAHSGVDQVSIWEYNPARWVICLLIVYMFIRNMMLMQQHMC
jgi:hypothetical protein